MVGAIGDIIRTHVILRIDPFELRQLIDDDHAAVAAAVIAGDAERGARRRCSPTSTASPRSTASHWDGDVDEIIEWK